MHQIKLFTGTANTYGVQKMQDELNTWLREAKAIFNAMVIQRTDMIEACGIIIYSIYYTYLPNEPTTIQQSGSAEDTGRTG